MNKDLEKHALTLGLYFIVEEKKQEVVKLLTKKEGFQTSDIPEIRKILDEIGEIESERETLQNGK